VGDGGQQTFWRDHPANPNGVAVLEAKAKRKEPKKQGYPVASLALRSQLYSRLLELCPPTAGDLAALAQDRGLSAERVAALRIGRLPDQSRQAELMEALEREFGRDVLMTVPGIVARGRLAICAAGPGLLIPVGPAAGDHISSMQIRLDTPADGGRYRLLSSGDKGAKATPEPYTVAPATRSASVAVLTEGWAKALAAADRYGALAIGVPGVSQWGLAMPILRDAGVSKILVAWDADHQAKEQVFKPLASAVAALRAEGYEVSLLLWPEAHKGIDDAILAGAELLELTGDKVDRHLQAVAERLGLAVAEHLAEELEEELTPYQRMKAKAEAAFTFFACNGTAYLATPHGTAMELDSKAAERRIQRALEKVTGKPPSAEVLRQIANSKAAEVLEEGPFAPVFRRVGCWQGRHYLDLGRSDGQVAEMSANGWNIVNNPPGLFWKRKTGEESALPIPIKGGDVLLLEQVLNAKGAELKFLIGFLVAILRSGFSFPLLVIEGSAGSAKTFAAKVLKYMVDPSRALASNLPKSFEDVAVSCNAAHLLAYDNVDRVKPEMSDFLCQVATGSAIRKRALYTSSDESEIAVQNPVIISGIDGLVERADLASRCALVTLEPIRDAQRREERELWEIAERIRPQVLGGILDAFCSGLANLDSTPRPQARNIDFARFLLASENGLPWPTGEATEFLVRSRHELYEQALWKDRVALAVIAFQERHGRWSGTMADLLDALRPPSATGDDGFWPSTPHKLSRRIKQARPILEARGLEVRRTGASNRGPVYCIFSSLKKEGQSSQSSLESANGVIKPFDSVNFRVNFSELPPPKFTPDPDRQSELSPTYGELSGGEVNPKFTSKNGATKPLEGQSELSELSGGGIEFSAAELQAEELEARRAAREAAESWL
jgi:hypothetical protein